MISSDSELRLGRWEFWKLCQRSFLNERGEESTRDTGLLGLRKRLCPSDPFLLASPYHLKREIGTHQVLLWGYGIAKAWLQLLGHSRFKKLSWRVPPDSDPFNPKRQCQPPPIPRQLRQEILIIKPEWQMPPLTPLLLKGENQVQKRHHSFEATAGLDPILNIQNSRFLNLVSFSLRTGCLEMVS